MKIIVENPIFSKVTTKEDAEILATFICYKSAYWKQTAYRKIEKSYVRPLVKKGRFLTGFLPKIDNYCKTNNIPLEIVHHSPTLPKEYFTINNDLISNIPLPGGLRLKPDQVEAIINAVHYTRGVIFHPTGSGKTMIFLSFLKLFPKSRALIMVNSTDLLTQIADRAREFFPGEVGMIGAGLDNPKRITIATVQSLVNSVEEEREWFNSIEIVIVDECFPKGTPIRTTKGNIPIEELKIGDEIFCSTGVSKVKHCIQNNVPLNRIIKMNLSDGREIICSDNHPFFSKGEWILAKDMRKKEIFTFPEFLSNIVPNITLGDTNYGQQSGNEMGRNTNNYMQDLRKRNQNSPKKSKILQPRMFVCEQGIEKILFEPNGQIEYREQRSYSRKNAKQQSDVESRKYREGTGYQKTTGDARCMGGEESRGERKAITYPPTDASSSSRVANGSPDSLRENSQLSHLLQNRYCKQEFETRNRSGRNRSPREIEIIRRKKDKKTGRTWVENIEILQRRDFEKFGISSQIHTIGNKEFVTLYNLEVENHPSYFANDILVHNCHHLSKLASPFETGKGGTYARVLSVIPAAIRLGFTATLPYIEEAKMALEGYIGPVISKKKISEVDRLAKIRVVLKKLPITLAAREAKSYQDVYRYGVTFNSRRHKLVLETAEKLVQSGRTVLILVTIVQHGENILNMANRLFPNMRIEFVWSGVAGNVRNQIKKDLNSGKVDVVIADAVWKEGVDIPTLGSIINAAGGKSEILTLQSLGRGLRTVEGIKEDVILVDLFDDSHYHLAHHFSLRLVLYFSEGWLGETF